MRFRLAADSIGMLLGVILPLGCTTDSANPDDRLVLPTLIDRNPDPKIVEVDLVAAPAVTEYLPGKKADVWAYRDGSPSSTGKTGSVPGPVLEAKLGDEVIVHFKNELPEATTIHWHGLRVPNASDGTHATQAHVPPGGEFEYRFVAKDAGTFWYHPHLHGDVQVESGLYGAVVVRDVVVPEVAADRILVLDDVKLAASGKLSAQTDALDMMLGRQGNVLLVNGQKDATLRVSAGSRERWRFINSANGRYFRLALAGHSFYVIGWDGGLLPEPYATETLLVAPGERYDVLVTLRGDLGSAVALQTLHYDRGHNVPDPGPKDLLEVTFASIHTEALPGLPSSLGAWAPLPVSDATIVRSFVLSEKEDLPEPRFFINDEAFPSITPVLAVEDAVEIWDVQNDAEMDHPFHLHGMFFQVLAVSGKEPEHQGWKDTVNIPKGASLRFAVRYGTPGRWMYHCHILEHAERGMMGELVIRGTSP